MNRKLLSLFVAVVIVLSGMMPLTNLSGSKSVSASTGVTPMVSAGCNFSLVLLPNGTVWSFGVNELAELGNGKITTASKPTRVLGLSDVVSVDCAGRYALALKKDGTVWGWGSNGSNCLGNGKLENCCYATKIKGISDVKAVEAGDGIVTFLKNDGTVWYYYDQETKASTIRQFKDLKDIVQISFQHIEGIALSKDGHVWTFGCGYSDKGTYIVQPKKVNISNAKKVETGDFHYIVEKKDNSIWMWGNNGSGQLGNGTTDYCDSPTQFKGLKNIDLLATGMYFTLAEKDGTVYAWGDNQSGQFGNNTRKSTSKPVKISRLKNVVAMDGGYYHTVALKSNGDVMVMGYNDDGILGVGDTGDKLTPCKVMNINDKKCQSTTDNNIYADGSLEDWGKVTPLATGTASYKSSQLIGIKKLYAKMDNKYLYLAATVTGGIPASVDFHLDMDGDKWKDYTVDFEKNTGCAVLYLFKGTKWLKDEDVFGAYCDVVEIKIALSGLGNPKAIHLKAFYGDDKKKYGVNSEITTWKVVPGSKMTASDKTDTDYPDNATQDGKPQTSDQTTSDQTTSGIKVGKITLDGKLDDWNSMEKTVYEDPKGDAGNGIDMQTIYAAKDDQYLYIAAKVVGNNHSIKMKLDCNGDGIEEYGANGNNDADAVHLFRFQGGAATEFSCYNYIAYDDVVEMAVPLKDFNNPENIAVYMWTNPDNQPEEADQDETDGYFKVVNIK